MTLMMDGGMDDGGWGGRHGWDYFHRAGRAVMLEKEMHKLMHECTFKPTITPLRRSEYHSVANFHQRNLDWKDKRERKLAAERERRAVDEDSTCTFAPSLMRLPSCERKSRWSSSRHFSFRQPKS